MYTLVEQKPCGENWCVIDLLFDVYICNYRCSVSHLQKQFLLFQVKKAIQFNPFTATDRIVDAAITKSNKKHHVLPDSAVVENIRKLVQRYRSA